MIPIPLLHRLRVFFFQSLDRKLFYGWVVVGVTSLVMFGSDRAQRR